MSQKSRTKEERFLIAFYELLPVDCSEEEALSVELSRYRVGIKAGLSEKGINAISHQMVRSNFFKKCGEEDIRFTRTGLKVALAILSE